MAKNKKTNWDSVKWTPFREATLRPHTPLEQQRARLLEDAGSKVYINSIYQVLVELSTFPPPFGRTVYLSIKTLDKQPRHDWRELQRIKNELVGEEVEAIELYPAESRVVDTANQYHLFCFPELQFAANKFPFGFTERLVCEGSDEGSFQTGRGARQRDFRPEFRPPDIQRGILK